MIGRLALKTLRSNLNQPWRYHLQNRAGKNNTHAMITLLCGLLQAQPDWEMVHRESHLLGCSFQSNPTSFLTDGTVGEVVAAGGVWPLLPPASNLVLPITRSMSHSNTQTSGARGVPGVSTLPSAAPVPLVAAQLDVERPDVAQLLSKVCVNCLQRRSRQFFRGHLSLLVVNVTCEIFPC